MNCLIVEDDPTLQSFLVTCLEDMGHSTVSSGTVEDALRRLKTQKFDLLLVDFSLPDGTSVPIMDYFGATCPNSRAILLTGSGVYPNGEASIFAPSVDWTLRKPVELQDLKAIVDYAGAGHQSPPCRREVLMAQLRLLSLGIFLVAAGFAFAAWSVLDSQRNRNIDRLVQRDIDAHATLLVRDLRARIVAISHISLPWTKGQAPSRDDFYREAEAYLAELPGLHAIAYINPEFMAEFVSPEAVNWFEGRSIASLGPERRRALERARDDNQIGVSAPVDLADGSGLGFLISEPIFSEGHYLGTVQIVFNAERWLSHLYFAPEARRIMPELSTRILLGGVPIHTSGDFVDIQTEAHRSEVVQVAGSSWQIEAKPRATFFATHRNTGPESIAGLVFVLVVAAGFFALMAQHAYMAQTRAARSALNLASANRALRREANERKRAEDAAENARKVASHFLSTMSHEIRTPLNGILGMFQLIASSKDVPNVQRRQAASGIDASRHLHRELSHMIDVAQLDVGSFEIHRKDTALAPCITTWQRKLKSLLGQADKPIHGHCEVSADLPVSAHIDAQALGLVIENLLDNAVKFTESGYVLLQIGQSGTALDIIVADTGPGILHKDTEAIFERFFQGDTGAARLHPGSGLGLTISLDLVRLMGGELSILPPSLASETAETGARFRVRLPECLDQSPQSEVTYDLAGNG